MKVSIVLPVFNSESTISECLSSLVHQSKKASEIIVVDDGSTDSTVKKAKLFSGIKLIELKKNQGRSKARNAGLKKARFELVFFAEADAVYSENFLEECVRAFSDEKVGGVIGRQEVWNSIDSTWTKCKQAERKAAFRHYKPFSAWMYLRSVLIEVGGFDENLDFGEDVDLANRVKKKGYKLAFASKAVWKHREPTSLLALCKRQWRFGFGMKPFYEKNGWSKMIFFDFLFFLSLVVGFVFPVAWIFSIFFLAAKVLLSSRIFQHASPTLWPALIVFVIIPSLCFKAGRLTALLFN